MTAGALGIFKSLDRRLFADRYGTPALLRRLLREHALVHLRSYLAAYAMMGIVAGCTAATTYMFGKAVNQTYFMQDYRTVGIICLAIMAVFTVRGLAYYGQAVLLARISNEINTDLQRRMFDKVLAHSVGFFAQSHSSVFTGQLTYGCFGVAAILNLLITASGRDVVMLVSLAGLMIKEDPLLATAALVVIPTAMMFLRKLTRRVRAQATAQYAGSANILLMLQDTLQGIRVVKAFRLEETIRRHVGAAIVRNQHAADRMAALSNRPTPIMEMLGGVALAALFFYAAYRIQTGSATPGGYVTFMASFMFAYEPAKRLARLNIELVNYLMPARVLFEFLDAPATEPDEQNKPALRVDSGRLAFEDVSFSYRADQPVLRGTSFVAEAGQRTALVGISGGGKSTAMALMLRFHEPQSGLIAIDGQDIATRSRESLRDCIAYVGQDTFLFSSTIRDNITSGRADATQEEIVSAARAAYLDEFIASLPLGYDTPVGELGTMLSGGERQRVAIARALLKNAPIILLDEATASLDGESEAHVRAAIATLCKGRTTIVIAHRLHTITSADKIVVIERGRVVEEGNHAELMRRNGRYATFFQLQFAKEGGEDLPAGEFQAETLQQDARAGLLAIGR